MSTMNKEELVQKIEDTTQTMLVALSEWQAGVEIDYHSIKVKGRAELLDLIEHQKRAYASQQAREARIDENQMYIRELTRHYHPAGPDEPHIPLVQFHERIAELEGEVDDDERT